MCIAISWWGVLLYNKNMEHYSDQVELMHLRGAGKIDLEKLEETHSRQSLMIIGEGVVLALTLLAGIWIINKSAMNEIRNFINQNNFLLSVSHELKSPIAAIKLTLQTLQRQIIDSERRKDLLNKAVMDTDRLENMVQNILLSANIDNKEFELFYEDFDLIELVKTTISKIAVNHPEAEIHLNNEMEILKISADRAGLNMVITNIVENAIKYSEASKEVWIEIKVNDTKESHVSLIIKDQGIGIPEAHKKDVFRRFYRINDMTTRTQKGTGLGLFISNKIVRAHKGSIFVMDNSPKGSIFDITLPYERK